MRTSLLSSVRRRTLVAAAGTAVVLAAGGGATAAFASTGAAAPSTSTATCAPHLRAVLHVGTPKALRADLKKLRAEPAGQRAAERKAIRAKMAAGAYGERIERLAHLAGAKAGKGHGWVSTLPAALQTDLKALRGLEAKSDARKAKAQAIVQKAVDGGYGTAIQERAKRVEAHVQARCAAKAAQG